MEDLTGKLSKATIDSKFELSFKGKGLKLDKGEDAKEIVEEIVKCHHMTALRLEGNTVGVEAAAEIAKALRKHPEFERALWSDMFTGRLKTEIPNALKYLGAAIMETQCHLVEIDLSDNAFGPNGVVGLVDLLKSESCYSLSELRLNNNGLGIGGGKMLAECLTECHKQSMTKGRPLSLRVFISGRNRLENDGAKALAAAFKAIGTLEYLAMPQNGINHPGIAALADAIAANPNLKHLNLNDNTFTASGAETVAKALPKLKALEIINFGDCLIRTNGAKAIAGALQDRHQQLKELILSGNEISTEGALSVAESLEGKVNLVKVDLDANNLGEEGCEVVRETLAAVGLQEALASLSGDEGTDEEDEGDDDDDDDDDEEEPEDETDGEVSADPLLQVKGSTVTPQKQTISAKDFLAFPSPTKLVQMGPHCGDALLKEFGGDKTNIDQVTQAIFKNHLSFMATIKAKRQAVGGTPLLDLKAAVVVSKDDDAKTRACQCADDLLPHVFASVPNADIFVTNTLLVLMGLIKGEDKKRKAPSNITGLLLVLEHVLRQSYFPSISREILLCFLSRPHPVLEKSPEATHKILQTLYSF